MANTGNVSNVRANYTTGAVQTAPVGTTLPTSASNTRQAGFTDWGFVSEDGIVKTIERETEKKLDMNGNTVLVITKSHSLKFKFKPIEVIPEGFKVTYGDDNVSVDSNGDIVSYRINADELTPRSYIFDLLLADGRLMRVVCPKGQVMSNGDETMKLEELIGSELEIEMLEDSSGNKAYIYFANPTSTAASILEYSIHALGMDFDGVIDNAAGTIAVTVPNGTTLTALVATFTLSNGASAKVGSTAQVSGTTSNNFSSPKTYTVTAGDGTTTKSYTVTVTAASE